MNKTISHNLIDMETLERVAPVIRNVAHPLRLRILDYLALSEEPRTVGEIITACNAEQAIVSQQLRILKDQGVLAGKRSGIYIYYSIAERSVLHLLTCIRDHNAK